MTKELPGSFFPEDNWSQVNWEWKALRFSSLSQISACDLYVGNLGVLPSQHKTIINICNSLE